MGMMESIKRMKHLLRNRIYTINGKKHTLTYIGYSSSTLEVWYDSEAVRDFVEEMPYQEMVAHIFGGYQLFSGKKVRYILITNNWDVNDNWYYPDDQTWAITVKGVFETIRDTLKNRKKDIESLNEYAMKQELLRKGSE